MPPMPAPTATSDEPDRHDGGHEGAEHDEQDQQRDQEADADVAELSSSALRNTASPPSSTWTPRRSTAGDGFGEHGEGGLAHLALRGVEGQLGVADPAVLARWCRPRTGRRRTRRARGWRRRSSTDGDRRPGAPRACSPSSAAKTTRAVPLAASGKFSSSSVQRAGALAAGGGEVVGEGAAAAGGEDEDVDEDERPRSRWCARGASRWPWRCRG